MKGIYYLNGSMNRNITEGKGRVILKIIMAYVGLNLIHITATRQSEYSPINARAFTLN
jgi:hypothetical protein